MAFNFTLQHAEELLKGNKDVATWYKAMSKLFPKYKITTPERIAGFIAQCGHESNNFRVLEENLNYSADALNKIFPKYFTRAGRDAQQYHRKPEAIANIIYGGRMGNVQPGDGWRFRGRGVIQLTGRDNYTAFGKTINLPAEKVIDYVSTTEGALESALWYWNSRKLNAVADTGDIVKMTKLVNGGTIGLEDRKKHYAHAMEVLTGKKHHAPTPTVTTAPQAAPSSPVLRVGSRGELVAKMQHVIGVAADGVFGPATEAAVKTWQAHNGLTPDGIVGPATQAKMFA